MTSDRQPRTDNNFDALRLLLASAVAGYHLALLPGLAGTESFVRSLSVAAELGVQGFFVLSGYLVYGSLSRSGSIGLYAEKRVRRLYPAYATVVLCCGLGALVFSEAARTDLASVARYLGWNLIFLNFMAPDLPGVFQTNPIHAVNGALWTIKVEVMFYMFLPVLAWLLDRGRWVRWGLVGLIYASAELWRALLSQAGGGDPSMLATDLAVQLPGQLSFFVTGIALTWVGPRLLARGVLVALPMLVATLLAPVLEPLRALALGWVLAATAICLPVRFDAARFGDVSYGVYISHFPIIQLFVAAGVFATAPLMGFGVAALSVLAVAFALWMLVEKPSLRPDSAYRRAATASSNNAIS